MKIQFDPFVVSYEKINTPIGSFREECSLAVNTALLKNINNLPIVLMMSGGIDSELIGESLLSVGIHFKCVIGRLVTTLVDNYNLEFNHHDYEYAINWCRDKNIEIIFTDIDVFKDNRKLCEYASSAKGFSPQYACHMHIMKWCSDNGYFFICGYGDPEIVLYNNEYCLMDEQRRYSVDNFCKLHNLTGIPGFWNQDGRIISAFLKLPTVKALMSEGVPRILDYKHKCYSDVFEFKQRKKFTGFEYLQEWDYHLRTFLKKQNGIFDSKYYTTITHFQ